MADGQIVEVAAPEAFFEITQHERTQKFLDQFLGRQYCCI